MFRPRLYVCLTLVCATVASVFSFQTTIAQDADPVLVGVGDIASCSSSGDEATAKLLDTINGTVFTTGDNVYESGTDTEFTNCYEPSWGRHKARTRPSVGNHEYGTAGASGYFNYFGAAAGERGKGYYSYDLGAWHIIVLNSNCSQVGGCGAGSAQEQWLRADLAAHPTTCTLAYWHHPRFSSGSHGNSTAVQPLWQALYDAGADVVVSGHDHNYERFAPQTPSGAADPTFGIREFVAGMGGKSHYGFGTIQPNSQVRNSDTYGVLKLTLHATSYDWQFVPETGKTFTDSGTTTCHGSPTGTATNTPTPTSTSTTRVALPGRFEVEDYRAGGQGTGYSDTTTGNSGGAYRKDDVDIQTTSDSSGRYNVGWIATGEWLAYDVTVQTSGNYIFTTRVATPNSGKSFHIEVDGVNVTGPLAVPNTGGNQVWTDVRSASIALTAGNHTLKVVADSSSFNLNYVTVDPSSNATPTSTSTPTPTPTAMNTSTPTPTSTSTTRVALPGRFEVEDYRAGGQGTGYSDTTTGNSGGAYRKDDVDIQTTSDSSGRYNVGWIATGEWLAYDVTVQTSGNYIFTTRVATPNSGKSFHIEVDGVNVTGPLAVPNTGGNQVWTDVRTAPIALTAGSHTVKIVANSNSFNMNYVVVTGP